MTHSAKDEQLIKQILTSAKTIAMVGVSSIQKKEPSNNIRRRPSIIVMKYLQEFGYRVIPVNPSSAGKKIYGETVVAKLENVTIPIDIVNVFRPLEIGAKVLWLQYGIQNQEAQKIAKSANITYIANRCIKQEYQRLFLKVSPVFPALRT